MPQPADISRWEWEKEEIEFESRLLPDERALLPDVRSVYSLYPQRQLFSIAKAILLKLWDVNVYKCIYSYRNVKYVNQTNGKC